MTSRDRFVVFFEGKTPDRIAFFEQAVASSVASKLLGRPALTGSTSLHRDTAEAWLHGEEGYREFVARVVDDWADLADLLGADAIDPSWLGGGMDIGELREHYPDLTMWGGVPCGSVLALGTPEKVRAMALESIEKGKSGGGIILGSSNTIIPHTPPENVWAMADLAKQYWL